MFKISGITYLSTYIIFNYVNANKQYGLLYKRIKINIIWLNSMKEYYFFFKLNLYKNIYLKIIQSIDKKAS